MATTTTQTVQEQAATMLDSDKLSQANGRPQKLHGRAFYESIGSPKLVLAPMVAQSEFVCPPHYCTVALEP